MTQSYATIIGRQSLGTVNPDLLERQHVPFKEDIFEAYKEKFEEEGTNPMLISPEKLNRIKRKETLSKTRREIEAAIARSRVVLSKN